MEPAIFTHVMDAVNNKANATPTPDTPALFIAYGNAVALVLQCQDVDSCERLSRYRAMQGLA